MKRLTALDNNPTYLDRYISIRDRKHLQTRNQLVAEHDFVTERFNRLEVAITTNVLHLLTRDARAIALRDALRTCYDSPTQPLRVLKQAIKDAQPKRQLKYCPMCGTTLSTTFDHYLPAVRFPEFAVHPLNLVPCCSTCNSTKDDDWLAPAGSRQFLHAYSDQIPNSSFLEVTLHEVHALSGVGATFSLMRPQGVSDQQWGLIESHFRKLSLLERYGELSNDEIAEVIADCKLHLDGGGANARQFLRDRADERAAIHGRNHWRAVLMHALSEHNRFEDWLA